MQGGDGDSVSTAALWSHKHTAFTSARRTRNISFSPQFTEIKQTNLKEGSLTRHMITIATAPL